MLNRLDGFSWEEIVKMSQNHELKRGDAKQVELADGRNITIKVIAVDGDDYMGVKVQGTIFICNDAVCDTSHKDPHGYLPSEIKNLIRKSVNFSKQ